MSLFPLVHKSVEQRTLREGPLLGSRVTLEMQPVPHRTDQTAQARTRYRTLVTKRLLLLSVQALGPPRRLTSPVRYDQPGQGIHPSSKVSRTLLEEAPHLWPPRARDRLVPRQVLPRVLAAPARTATPDSARRCKIRLEHRRRRGHVDQTDQPRATPGCPSLSPSPLRRRNLLEAKGPLGHPPTRSLACPWTSCSDETSLRSRR